MSSQEWTTTPPVEPGWYWAITNSYPVPAMVWVTQYHHNPTAGKFMVKRGDTGKYSRLDSWKFWHGPLPVPEPPVRHD